MIENDYQPAPLTKVNGVGYVYKMLHYWNALEYELRKYVMLIC